MSRKSPNFFDVIRLLGTPVAIKGPRRKNFPVLVYAPLNPSPEEISVQVALVRLLRREGVPAQMVWRTPPDKTTASCCGNTPSREEAPSHSLAYARAAFVGKPGPEDSQYLSEKIGSRRPWDFILSMQPEAPSLARLSMPNVGAASLTGLFINRADLLEGPNLDLASTLALYRALYNLASQVECPCRDEELAGCSRYLAKAYGKARTLRFSPDGRVPEVPDAFAGLGLEQTPETCLAISRMELWRRTIESIESDGATKPLRDAPGTIFMRPMDFSGRS
jgi:hypothetical protein